MSPVSPARGRAGSLAASLVPAPPGRRSPGSWEAPRWPESREASGTSRGGCPAWQHREGERGECREDSVPWRPSGSLRGAGPRFWCRGPEAQLRVFISAPSGIRCRWAQCSPLSPAGPAVLVAAFLSVSEMRKPRPNSPGAEQLGPVPAFGCCLAWWGRVEVLGGLRTPALAGPAPAAAGVRAGSSLLPRRPGLGVGLAPRGRDPGTLAPGGGRGSAPGAQDQRPCPHLGLAWGHGF